MSCSGAGRCPNMSESFGSRKKEDRSLRRNCQPPVGRWLSSAGERGKGLVRTRKGQEQTSLATRGKQREFEENKSRICNEIPSGTGIRIMHIYYYFLKKREHFS